MSRINTNVTSLIAQNALNNNNTALNTSLERLSTGLRINSGADDPSGIIASQALQQEQTGLNTAISNAQRADNVIGTAAGGLNEVSSLLTQVQGLVSQSANTGGLSQSENAANQLQVDSILQTIDRIAGSTQFQGKNLLNGNLGDTTSAAATSAFATLQINAAEVPSTGGLSVVVQVANSATTGKLTYTSTASAAGTALIGASGVTLEIAGNNGTQELSFAGSSSLSSVVTAINNIKNSTGVSASVSGAALNFNSTGYGSSQYVSVKSVSGTFSLNAGSSNGTNAVVNVNGAAATADGKNISFNDSNLDLNFTLSSDLNAGASKTFFITGGGATFALGATVSQANNTNIGIQSVSSGSLGDSTNGFLSSLATGGANSLSSSNLDVAQTIVSEAINQVSTLSGRLGAFQTYTLGSTINSLNIAYENASSAESDIADTDFAKETANLTRAQILSQSATTVLTTANAQPQQVLKLLG